MAVGGTRQKLSMIASVANQDRACRINIDGALSHEWLVEFFDSLVLDVNGQFSHIAAIQLSKAIAEAVSEGGHEVA